MPGGSLKDSERDLGAGHAGDLFGEFTDLMRAVGKFETKQVTPKQQGSLETANCDASVIRSQDSKRRSCAHAADFRIMEWLAANSIW
ncbi:MAG: hypothetical protein QOH88_2283 [Verrucomicrobiota bacterium]